MQFEPPINLGEFKHRYNCSGKQKDSALELIAQLQYLDLWKHWDNGGTICNNEFTRIVIKGTFPFKGATYGNYQVHVSGLPGNSLIAHVNVSENIASKDDGIMVDALKAVTDALRESLQTGHSFRLTGIHA